MNGKTIKHPPDEIAKITEPAATRADHDCLRIWLRLMKVHKLVANELRQRLQSNFDVTLARFDLMAQLERTRVGLRMVELSKNLMVTSGNITQVTDLLEREGLVERRPDPSSRRSRLVRLTRAGRDEFVKIAKTHEEWIVELLSSFSQKERKSLLSLLAKQCEELEKAHKNRKKSTDRQGTKRAAGAAAYNV